MFPEIGNQQHPSFEDMLLAQDEDEEMRAPSFRPGLTIHTVNTWLCASL